MSYLIFGASSGLGKELAHIFAKNLNNLIIISRDERDLKAIKSDLENKFKVNVKYFNPRLGDDGRLHSWNRELAVSALTRFYDFKKEIKEEYDKQEGEELPENIQKLMQFMEDTGGDLEDYVRLNQDYSKKIK